MFKKINLNGIWANKDYELVKTDKFLLLFERTDNNISVTLQTDTIITVIFDIKNKKTKKVFNKKVKLSKENGNLKLDIDGNKFVELYLVESITIVQPYLLREARQNNINICLQEWGVGSYFVADNTNKHIGISIETNKHSYIFVIGNLNGENVIYCRAAKMSFSNKGLVFVQHIRLMQKTNEFTAYVAENNLSTTSKDVKVSEAMFNVKVCNDRQKGIYWPVKSFDKNVIILSGCGEEEYKISRLSKDMKNKVEWFKVIK